MKAAVYYSNSDVRVEEMPVPEIGTGEMLLKVMASGICGSDVMEWYRIKKAPLVLGHEVAGVVERVGEGVERFQAGDRVTVAHHVPCNTCRFCLRGEFSVCDTLRSTNFFPGGFAQFLRVPAINVDRGTFTLPPDMSFEEATFAEPLGCVVRGLRKAGFTAGKTLLVLGSGISGLLHIKLARALGASAVAATDINETRLKMAEAAGADFVFNASLDVPDMVTRSLGRPADIVAICAGSSKAVKQAIDSVERAGTLLFFAPGQPGETYPMPLFELWRDNITIINTYASPPADTLTALDLMAGNTVDVSDMITHRLGINDAAEGFDLVSEAGQSIKVIIEPNA
ncbi:MAG: alcohol dehydrogenase catalytic domain-containing protein [Thermodesulfobacteriota bacterium]